MNSNNDSNNAICQVCGEQLDVSNAAYCSKCETPHHSDCFQYNSRCATYGCDAENYLIQEKEGWGLYNNAGICVGKQKDKNSDLSELIIPEPISVEKFLLAYYAQNGSSEERSNSVFSALDIQDAKTKDLLNQAKDHIEKNWKNYGKKAEIAQVDVIEFYNNKLGVGKEYWDGKEISMVLDALESNPTPENVLPVTINNTLSIITEKPNNILPTTTEKTNNTLPVAPNNTLPTTTEKINNTLPVQYTNPLSIASPTLAFNGLDNFLKQCDVFVENRSYSLEQSISVSLDSYGVNNQKARGILTDAVKKTYDTKKFTWEYLSLETIFGGIFNGGFLALVPAMFLPPEIVNSYYPITILASTVIFGGIGGLVGYGLKKCEISDKQFQIKQDCIKQLEELCKEENK